MAEIVDYDYIIEQTTLDAWRNLASDTTNWYSQDLPWVNTFLINAEAQAYNFPEWWGWLWIAGWDTDVKWTPWVWSIGWSSGNINLPDGTQISISSGSASVSAPTYIYVNQTDWTVSYTTTAIDAVWENKIMICAAFPNTWKNVTFKAFGCADQNSLATWSDIAAWTITANNIASNTITASQIASWTITANEIAGNTITSSEIKSWAVTASKIDVSQLSAISANLWTITAWDITGTSVTAGSTSWTAIVLNPSQSRIQIYYGWSVVWYIAWAYVSWLWNAVLISSSYLSLPWTVSVSGKLKIPVWSNLY